MREGLRHDSDDERVKLRLTTTWIAACAVALAAGTLAACSDGSESAAGSGAGEGGTTASSAQAGGTGGAACGDIQTDPLHCGACNHPCAPGQTCAAGSCTCGPATAAFAADVQPILSASCAVANCHKGSVANGVPVPPKAGLDLSPATAYAALVGPQSSQCASSGGRALVVPGQPEDSYVIDKLTGTQLCAGKRMPPPPAALPTAQIQTISDWICAGALND